MAMPSTAASETPEIPPQRASAEQILLRTVVASMVLHATLFLITRTPPTWSNEFDFLPDLRIWIEQPADQEVVADDTDPVRSAAEADKGMPPLAATTPQAQEAQIDSPSPAAEPRPLAQSLTAPATTLEQVAPLGEQSAKAYAGELLTTAGDSDQLTAATTEARAVASSEHQIPRAEREMLAARIKAWSRAFEGTDMSRAQLRWQENGRSYQAVLKLTPAADAMDIDRVVVEVTADEDGQLFKSRMQFKRLAFSHFTKLIDQWDTEVQLHDDVIGGRFHSNSEIQLGWDRNTAPKFLGNVTIASRHYKVAAKSHWRPREEIFAGGLETSAQRIELPRSILRFSSIDGGSERQVRSFAHDTHLELFENGDIGWRAHGGEQPEQRESIAGRPLYLLADPGVRLFVRGTVRGTVLVYSPEQVVITGSIRYAHDVRALPEAKDYFGIVSNKDVVIADPEITGPGDLRIDGAIYARRRFHVRSIGSGGNAKLAVYGSLSAGTISATEPRYATHVEFDRRFERLRPPGFPMTAKYELEPWDGVWTAVSEEQ
jgi:hypothetical protein